MEKKINNELFVTTNDGRQLTFKVLFTYHSEDFEKDYVFFYEENDEDNIIVYSYDDSNTLHEIEDEEEFKELDEVLEAYDEEHSKKEQQ
ncbi:MAG: DUF1292 domain-containing protein [Erysipelotrichaceae bacterium]|nr:DUF1292 domain-containing protein [Erysipelotrichaceae bacterium]